MLIEWQLFARGVSRIFFQQQQQQLDFLLFFSFICFTVILNFALLRESIEEKKRNKKFVQLIWPTFQFSKLCALPMSYFYTHITHSSRTLDIYSGTFKSNQQKFIIYFHFIVCNVAPFQFHFAFFEFIQVKRDQLL